MTSQNNDSATKYVITEDDIHTLFDYFQAALDGNEAKKTLKRLFEQECGIIRSKKYPKQNRTVILDELELFIKCKFASPSIEGVYHDNGLLNKIEELRNGGI